jgi:hypothetical protein
MSRPEIALHINNVMRENKKVDYQKRSQKDYSMSFNFISIETNSHRVSKKILIN